MEVEIAKEIGFCFGVRKAIESLDKITKEDLGNGEIYVTGELVHNKDAIKKYEEAKVKFTTNIEEYKDTVVIRAHGISDEERERIKNNPNVRKIIDATCPYVLRVHYLTKKMVKEGYHIIIVGEKDHPETRGYYLNVKDYCTVIEPAVGIKELPKVKKVAVFAQTTMNYEKFKEIAKELITEFEEVRIFMTICPPVINRQKSVIELSKNCDLMIVLGGYNSSNTKKLRELCAKYTEAVHIERINQLNLELLKGKKKVGIAAGTSTPDWIIQEAYEFLKNYNPS